MAMISKKYLYHHSTVAGTMREAAYLAEHVEETAQISLLAGR
ncbi:hypothetical protein [uncultured Clostridium sp.]|nr:hypothetical protein [uncultured Clostridium sp.]